MNLHLASMIAIVGSLEPGERWCVRHAELGRPNTLSEFLAEDRILENIIGSGHTHGYTRNAVHRTTTFYRAREGQVPEGYHTYVSPDHREYFKKVHLNGLDLYRPKMS